MSENPNPNSETRTSLQDPTSFFSDYDPEIEVFSESEESEKTSRKEKLSLFGGDLTDIEAFLKHEEIKLRFLEFKLKKKTQISDDRSRFKDRKNERTLRKENAKKAFWFSCIWAIFIALFIVLHAIKHFKIPFMVFIPQIKFGFIEFDFILSQSEFIFVCGTLTASILIFYLTVIKNLFPNKFDNNKKE